jgi:thiol:disulfide interchange protein
MRTRGLLIALTLALGAAGCGGGTKAATGPAAAGPAVTTWEEALASARSTNKPILLVAYQGSPKDMEMMILSDPMITQRMSKVVTAKVDGNQHAAALARINVTTFPSIVVFRPDGTYVWGKQGANPIEVANNIDSALGVPSGQ